jgi:hypothetical protein
VKSWREEGSRGGGSRWREVEGRRDRFFDKKHRHSALCLWDFSGLLGPFWTAILEVNFALFCLFKKSLLGLFRSFV